MKNSVCKVLIGSAVRQKPAILEQVLRSLAQLNLGHTMADFMFVDNNDAAESSLLLQNFRRAGSTVYLGTVQPENQYTCTEETHYWNHSLIWKVASYKDFILNFAVDKGYSHIFLVDSDLVLHPFTLTRLLDTGKDIVSEIFWTKWNPHLPELPQVWLEGQYSFYRGGSTAPQEEQKLQTEKFLESLRKPGLYEVGGLGACTLISSEAVKKGVCYHKITNLDYWGEDRHFCIRAAVLGFKLYVDTTCPAFHIYRESDLARVEEYKKECFSKIAGTFRKTSGNKLTLAMIVRNEADRYLVKMLNHARQYIDEAVIIDDASTDRTAAICEEILSGIPLKMVRRDSSGFSSEFALRRQQWEETLKTDPDWILALDADEIFEDKIITGIKDLINQTSFDVIAFRLFDFWDEQHYREDNYWQAHKAYRPFLIRPEPGFDWKWKETPQHCGRFPQNITGLSTAVSHLRLKHFGWATEEDRVRKYRRYLELDPEGLYGVKEQYESILDASPNLVLWEE